MRLRALRRTTVLAASAGVIAATALGAGTATGSTGVLGTGSPSYVNYPGPTNLVGDAGEPSIGVNPKTGAALLLAGTTTAKAVFNDSTTPARVSWSDVSFPTTSVTTLDPILFTDTRTGRAFVSQLAGACSLSAYTDDDGATYKPSQGCGVGTVEDHQTFGGGPYPTGAIPGPLTSYPDAAYYCAQADLTENCARSDDGGTTFGPGVSIYNAVTDNCVGLSGHIRVGPDGAAYVPNFDCNGHVAVSASTDAGTTWKVHEVPGSETQDESDPSVAVGAKNTVYLGWEQGKDNSFGSKAFAAVSHDHGKTWSHLTDVGAPLGIRNVQFPEMIAGDDNRAAFAFLGSKTAGNDQLQNFPGVFHLYIATTYNGGSSWSVKDVTPNNPVQRGGINLGGFNPGGSGPAAKRNLLDFNDITLDKLGRVYVGWADGCTGGCVTSASKNTYTALGTITRQSSGRTLYAAYDR